MNERKILIVDDEVPIREMLEMAFDRAGYLIRTAAFAQEALDILKQESIQLMSIDLGLEKMNGFELFKTVRKDCPNAIIFALLLIKFLQFKSRFSWSLSNLIAFLRWNLFTYRDVWQWIDKPFETKPLVPRSVQNPLPFIGFGQHLLIKNIT